MRTRSQTKARGVARTSRVDSTDGKAKALSWWSSPDPSKRDFEMFVLKWSGVWIGIMGFVVASGIYESMDEWHFLYVGLAIGLPPVFLPLLMPSKVEAVQPLSQRYSTKANAWIFVFGFVGNYIWTHYFYKVLGCSYTFPSHRFNNVPICCYLITHSYFLLYHLLGNVVIRAYDHFFDSACGAGAKQLKFLLGAFLLFSFCTFIAFMEVFTLMNFPHYRYADKFGMWVYGSMFYAMYFFVSFPMFSRLDAGKTKWTLSQAILDSCAASMIVTILLDFWRLHIGNF